MNAIEGITAVFLGVFGVAALVYAISTIESMIRQSRGLPPKSSFLSLMTKDFGQVRIIKKRLAISRSYIDLLCGKCGVKARITGDNADTIYDALKGWEIDRTKNGYDVCHDCRSKYSDDELAETDLADNIEQLESAKRFYDAHAVNQSIPPPAPPSVASKPVANTNGMKVWKAKD